MLEKKKKNKYETKIEHLTYERIFLVYLCEVVLEFSFGVIFIYYALNYPLCNTGDDATIHWYVQLLSITYTCEFTLATVCFLIGLASLAFCQSMLTKIYVSFNNFFKSFIVLLSIILLGLVIYQYLKKGLTCNVDNCGHIKIWLILWMSYQLVLLGIAAIAALFLCGVSVFLYCKDYDNQKMIDILDKTTLKDKLDIGVNE